MLELIAWATLTVALFTYEFIRGEQMMKPVFVVWIETSQSAQHRKLLALLDDVVWMVKADTPEDATRIVTENVPGIFECHLNIKSMDEYVITDGVCIRMNVGEVY